MNEREQLLADLHKEAAYWRNEKSGTATGDYVARLLDRAIAALSEPQPLQGWVMVPIEPTKKMISAGYTAEHCASTHRTAALVYRAMIEAAQDK